MGSPTPGPWDWRSPSDGTRVVSALVGGTSRDIAILPPEDANRFPDTLSANARLIAAAPDLLEACKSALADLGDLVRHAEPASAREQAAGLHGSLSMAIRKAEGK